MYSYEKISGLLGLESIYKKLFKYLLDSSYKSDLK
jgi:hypothetical protein